MAKNKLENKLLAVVRVRGRVNIRTSIEETLNRLNLKRINNLAVVYGSKSNIGMLYACNDYVTYGEIAPETLSQLLEKREIKVDAAAMNEIASGKKSLKASNIKVPIKMKPPKHGYRNTKKSYVNGGDLGYRGEEINKLIKRMM